MSILTGSSYQPKLHKDMEIVFVDQVMPQFVCMPAKTRPKKISVRQSNGEVITFLLKGFEDLHLDERVMQLLQTVNAILVEPKSYKTINSVNVHSLSARHYSVVPFNSRTGLIRWVDHTKPLYEIYQSHEFFHKTISIHKGQESSENLSKQMKPLAEFYRVSAAILQQRGVSTLSKRSEWTIDLCMQIFKELDSHSRHDSLQKEVKMISIDYRDWWSKTRALSKSTAVMSMVGFILGLGDRHLSNILLDTQSGQLVHIDYSICFDKGVNLSVPEVVPFRLTPIIKNSLGISGLEGIFAQSCNYTLGALRNHADVLLSLLETFVHDPLLDWGSNNKAQLRHEDVSVTLTLLHTKLSSIEPRIAENLTKWQLVVSNSLKPTLWTLWNSLEDTQQALNAINSHQKFYLDCEQRLHDARQRFVDLHNRLIEACTNKLTFVYCNTTQTAINHFMHVIQTQYNEILDGILSMQQLSEYDLDGRVNVADGEGNSHTIQVIPSQLESENDGSIHVRDTLNGSFGTIINSNCNIDSSDEEFKALRSMQVDFFQEHSTLIERAVECLRVYRDIFLRIAAVDDVRSHVVQLQWISCINEIKHMENMVALHSQSANQDLVDVITDFVDGPVEHLQQGKIQAELRLKMWSGIRHKADDLMIPPFCREDFCCLTKEWESNLIRVSSLEFFYY